MFPNLSYRPSMILNLSPCFQSTEYSKTVIIISMRYWGFLKDILISPVFASMIRTSEKSHHLFLSWSRGFISTPCMGKKIILVFLMTCWLLWVYTSYFQAFIQSTRLIFWFQKYQHKRQWKSGGNLVLNVSVGEYFQLGENSDREYRLGVATRKGGKKGQKGAV